MSGGSRIEPLGLAQYAARSGLAPRTVEHSLGPLAATLCLTDPDETAHLAALLCTAFLLTSGGLITSEVGSAFLPRGLARLLSVRHGARAELVEERGEAVRVSWTDTTAPGTAGACEEEFDAVVLAVPPTRVPALHPRLAPPTAGLFRATRYAPTLQVAFCLDRTTAERSVMLHLPRCQAPLLAACTLQHSLSPHRIPRGRGLATAYFRGGPAERAWEHSDEAVIEAARHELASLAVLPELKDGVRTAYVDRIGSCVVRRRPGEYHDIAQALAVDAQYSSRVHLAGGDHFGHSTTIGSIASGDRTAQAVLTRHTPPRGLHPGRLRRADGR
ncbi:FAD-dependent oxidoreductase [Streptomyces sp. NBC_01362]|uniref:FAD-dependent oxidoreductase n=1 Tax=Streptomyces sp. NBC_01362 TaxID=2903839 RepID=UPI002E313E4F|nr:FAD-dependent oxidoreductase [Streptomyces sp. NBC_01362]